MPDIEQKALETVLKDNKEIIYCTYCQNRMDISWMTENRQKAQAKHTYPIAFEAGKKEERERIVNLLLEKGNIVSHKGIPSRVNTLEIDMRYIKSFKQGKLEVSDEIRRS
ncbi:MAG: hypothetical protein ACFFDI_25040 [Promethearchaeota archaeon]